MDAFVNHTIVDYVLGCFILEDMTEVVGFGEACFSNLLCQDVNNIWASKCYRLEHKEGGIL